MASLLSLIPFRCFVRSDERTRMLVLACLFTMACVSASLAQLDPVLQARYESALQLQGRGEELAAVIEYKSFLSGALQQVGMARAEAAEFDLASRAFQDALTLDEKDVELRLSYIAVLFAERNYERAEAAAKSAAQLAPSNPRTQLALARALLEQGKYSQAKPLLDAALGPSLPIDSWCGVVSTYLKKQQVESARAVIRKIVATFGDNAETRFAAGIAYYYGDDPIDAAEEFRRAIALDGSARDFHYYLALALLGNDEDAAAPQAMPEFEAELKINPDDYRSHHMLGYLGLNRRDFALAEAELSRAAVLNAQYPASMMYLGEVYQETGRDAEAERALRKAIALSGEAVDNVASRAHYMLGRLLQKSGNAPQAADELKTSEQLRRQIGVIEPKPPNISLAKQEKANALVRQIAPMIGRAYADLSAIAARHGDFASATSYIQNVKNWQSALEPDARVALAEAHASRGELEQAEHEARSAIGLDPKLERAHLLLGIVLFGKHQSSDAEKEFRAALQLKPADTPAMYLLALALIDTRQHDEAIALLAKVVAEQPGNADALYRLGTLQLEHGDAKSAIASLEVAAKLNARSVPVHYELAKAYRRDSRAADADREESLVQQLRKP